MLYTGPTLQCGLSFNQKTHTQIQPDADIAISVNNKYDSQNINALKRINVTWGIGAGLQYERYFIRGGYDFGIINPYKAQIFNVTDDYHPYTRGRFDQWQLKLGMYLFSW
jgi:hypothetical protein